MPIKAFPEGKEPPFPSSFEVVSKKTLNFTDIVNNNNKFYNLEIQVATSGDARIYTNYGRVGGSIAKEYRPCADRATAEKEADKLIKSKIKKGYTEISLVKLAVGSDVAKSQVNVVHLKPKEIKSSLHPEVAKLVRAWFGATQEFIDLNLDTKKCPLGQLSQDQIQKGKDILLQCQGLIKTVALPVDELNRLTNQYYSNIPHNFGHSRINADVLRLDSSDKIAKAFDILDVFGDAKDIEDAISTQSSIDSQYKTLNSEIEYLEPSTPLWSWIEMMVQKTRARNHSSLGNIKVHRIFSVKRHGEEELFLKNAEKIAKVCTYFSPAEVYAGLITKRPELTKEQKTLYNKANINPGWHGTRRANMIGITSKGMLIKPSGVKYNGNMYDKNGALYFAVSSTKSINYVDCKGSYWAAGNNKIGYLFLCDVAFGHYKLANGPFPYTRENIMPCHSVYAMAGRAGVINDELMIYNSSGPDQQHVIRYIVEFETQA